MELYIYDSDLILYGVIDEITSLMWTRRYWKCGEFKLLVPFIKILFGAAEPHQTLAAVGGGLRLRTQSSKSVWDFTRH